MPAASNIGKLAAYDAKTLNEVCNTSSAPFLTAALSTAGGWVLIGDIDRRVHIFDLRTGRAL